MGCLRAARPDARARLTMITKEWANHIKGEEEKKGFLLYIMNSRALLDRLDQMLCDRETKLRSKELQEDYSSPSWSHLQADRLGQLKGIATVRKLLQHKGTITDD